MLRILVAGWAVTVLMAQSETGKSALEGRVLDPSGQGVTGGEVTLMQSETGQRRKVNINREGQFRAVALSVGTYTIEANQTGFAPFRSNPIELLVGETKSVTLTLAISSQSAQVTVDAAADIVNRGDINNSTTVSERQISDLPIRGRNFVEFIQLTPNVMQEGNRYGIVVNGQRSINSNISVDGMDFNDSLQGGQRGGGPNESAYFFPQLAVREFQVVRDGASAEVGRTNSGYVNVVTKSGTNNYHGAAFYANRNGSFTSPDAFGNDSSSNSQNQLGVSAGGPLRKDKLFFFAALEKNLVTIPYTVKFNTPSGGIALPAEIANQQGSFNQKNNPLVAFGRLDYQFTPSSTVNLQYTYAAQNGLNFGGQSGQTNQASTNNTILDRASQGIKAAVTTVWSASLLNELRGQYAFDNRTQKPNSTLAQVDIADLGTLGGSSNGTYIYNATRFQILDNLTWNGGRHTVKAGVDMNFSPQQQQRETNYGGRYTFSTLADYLAAVGGNNSRIGRYQQSIAANGTQGFYDSMQQDHAAFLTDSIRFTDRLTVSAGLALGRSTATSAHQLESEISRAHRLHSPRPQDVAAAYGLGLQPGRQGPHRHSRLGGFVYRAYAWLPATASIYRQRPEYAGARYQHRSLAPGAVTSTQRFYHSAGGSKNAYQQHLLCRSQFPQSSLRSSGDRRGATDRPGHESHRRLHAQRDLEPATPPGPELIRSHRFAERITRLPHQ